MQFKIIQKNPEFYQLQAQGLCSCINLFSKPNKIIKIDSSLIQNQNFKANDVVEVSLSGRQNLILSFLIVFLNLTLLLLMSMISFYNLSLLNSVFLIFVTFFLVIFVIKAILQFRIFLNFKFKQIQ